MRRQVWITLVLMAFYAGLFPAEKLRIIFPNGGQTLSKKSPVNIRWEPAGVQGEVVILLYQAGIKVFTISQAAPNNGHYLWLIPSQIHPHAKYRIRIRAIQNLSNNDFSDRDFKIEP